MEHKVRSGCVRFRYVGPLELAGSHDFLIVQGVEYINLEFSVASFQMETSEKRNLDKTRTAIHEKNASRFNSTSQRSMHYTLKDD